MSPNRMAIPVLSCLLWAAYFAKPAVACQTAPTTERENYDTEHIRDTVDETMSAPEYRHIGRPKPEPEDVKPPNWLTRFFDWLFSKRDGEADPAAFSWLVFLLRGLAYLIALAICGVIALVVARGLAWGNRGKGPKLPAHAGATFAPGSPPGELPSDEYLRRALEWAKAQDYRSAIRELLLGTMSWIERAGLIRFRRGLSNRDYLRAIWRRPVCRDSMSGIIDAFDRTYFGRRTATSEIFERCLELYRAGFIADATVSLAN